MEVVAVIAGVAVACSLAFWWHTTPPWGARKTCERFMTLLMNDKCREAYQLTARTSYGFSSLESFCEDRQYRFNETWRSGQASCNAGEWHGVEYVVFGQASRPSEQQSHSFGMRLNRNQDAWLVLDFTFDD